MSSELSPEGADTWLKTQSVYGYTIGSTVAEKDVDGNYDIIFSVTPDPAAKLDVLTEANTLDEGASEGTEPGQYKVGTNATLKTAIDVVNAIAMKNKVTKAEEDPAPGTAAEQGSPPAAEEGSPPAAEEGSPPAAEEGQPPAAEEGSPPAAEEGSPPAAEEGPPPAAEEGSPPAAEEGSPPAAEEGPPPAAEEGQPPAAEEGSPPADEEATQPAAEERATTS